MASASTQDSRTLRSPRCPKPRCAPTSIRSLAHCTSLATRYTILSFLGDRSRTHFRAGRRKSILSHLTTSTCAAITRFATFSGNIGRLPPNKALQAHSRSCRVPSARVPHRPRWFTARPRSSSPQPEPGCDQSSARESPQRGNSHGPLVSHRHQSHESLPFGESG